MPSRAVHCKSYTKAACFFQAPLFLPPPILPSMLMKPLACPPTLSFAALPPRVRTCMTGIGMTVNCKPHTDLPACTGASPQSLDGPNRPRSPLCKAAPPTLHAPPLPHAPPTFSHAKSCTPLRTHTCLGSGLTQTVPPPHCVVTLLTLAEGRWHAKSAANHCHCLVCTAMQFVWGICHSPSLWSAIHLIHTHCQGLGKNNRGQSPQLSQYCTLTRLTLPDARVSSKATFLCFWHKIY